MNKTLYNSLILSPVPLLFLKEGNGFFTRGIFSNPLRISLQPFLKNGFMKGKMFQRSGSRYIIHRKIHRLFSGDLFPQATSNTSSKEIFPSKWPD